MEVGPIFDLLGSIKAYILECVDFAKIFCSGLQTKTVNLGMVEVDHICGGDGCASHLNGMRGRT